MTRGTRVTLVVEDADKFVEQFRDIQTLKATSEIVGANTDLVEMLATEQRIKIDALVDMIEAIE